MKANRYHSLLLAAVGSAGFMAGITAVDQPVLAATYTWNASTVDGQAFIANSGNWDDPARWTDSAGAPAPYPQATDDVASFYYTVNAAGTTITSSRIMSTLPPTVNLDVPVTVGVLNLGDNGSIAQNTGFGWTLNSSSPSNSLTLSSSTGTATLNSGSSANFGGNNLINSPVVLASNTTITSNYYLTFAGPVSGTGGFTMQSGTPNETAIDLPNGNDMVIFSGSNSYSGGTTINAGNVEFTTPAALPTTGAVTVGPLATFSINTANWGGASGVASFLANPGTVTFSANSLVGLDTSGGSMTYNTNITGSYGIQKFGANVLDLGGANSYSGLTVIGNNVITPYQNEGWISSGDRGGELRISSSTALPSTTNLVFANLDESRDGVDNVETGTLELTPAFLNGSNTWSNVANTFTAALGYANGNVQWAGSGGFSAYDPSGVATVLHVNLGNGTPLTWGTAVVGISNSNPFFPAGIGYDGSSRSGSYYLILSSPTANATIDFQNNINLNGALRALFVNKGTKPTLVDAQLSGVISGGNVSLLSKQGFGSLELTQTNTFSSSMYVYGGTVIADATNAIPHAAIAWGFQNNILEGFSAGVISSFVPNGLGGGTFALGGGTVKANNIPSSQTFIIPGGAWEFDQASELSATAPTGTLNILYPGTVVAAGTDTVLAHTYAADQNLLTKAGTSFVGTIGVGANSSNNLDFTNYPTARLGAWIANPIWDANVANIQSVTYSGTLTPNGSTYRFGGGNANLIVSTALTGSRSLDASTPLGATAAMDIDWGIRPSINPSRESFTANNTMTGSATIGGLNIVTLSGASGALTSVSSVNIAGGQLKLDDSGGANANRLSNTAPINVTDGGTLNFNGTGGNTEVVGALNLNAGNLFVNTTRAGGSGNTTLSIASISRKVGATADFINDANSTVTFASAPTTYTSPSGQKFLGGWATNGAGDFATYDGTKIGVLVQDVSVDSTTNAAGWSALTSANNVLANMSSGTPTVPTSAVSVNSLKIAGPGTQTLNLGGQTLTVTSGGILSAATLATISNGTVTAGTGAGSNYELFLGGGNTGPTNLQITATIADNGGSPVSVVVGNNGVGNYSANNVTIAPSTQTNTYSGNTYINGGQLYVGFGTVTGTAIKNPLGTGVIYVNGFAQSDVTSTTFNNESVFGTDEIIPNEMFVNADLHFNSEFVSFNQPSSGNVGVLNGPIMLANNATVHSGQWNSGLQFNNRISGNGSMEYSNGTINTGPGAGNTYTGPTFDDGSIFALSGANNFGYNGNGVDAIPAGGLIIGGTFTFAGQTKVFSDGSGNFSNFINDNCIVSFMGDINNQAQLLVRGAGTETIGGLSSVGGVGQVTTNLAATSTATTTLNVAAGTTLTFTGTVSTSNEALTMGVLGLGGGTQILANTVAAAYTKGTNVNAGTLIVAGLNSLGSGTITLNGGKLQLDMSLGGSLNGSSALTMGGGNFLVTASSTGSSTQTLSALTLNLGNSKITLDPNNSTGVALNLSAAWTRNTGATLLVDYSSSHTGTRFVNTGSAVIGTGAASNGIFGYATVKDSGGTGFATQDGSFNIVRFDDTTATTFNSATAPVATTNYTTRPDAGTTTLSASGTVNSLTFDTQSGGTTLDLNGGTLALTSSGLLFKGPSAGTIQNGTLGSPGSELIVHQTSAAALTINSTISGAAGSLTKDGTGTLNVGGNNTYTGGTLVGDGTLKLNNPNALGASSGILTVDNTGTVDVNGNSITTGGLRGNAGTIDNTSSTPVSLTVSNDTNISYTNAANIQNSNPAGVVSLVLTGNNPANTDGAHTSTQTLAGVGTFTGTTTVNGTSAVLQLGNPLALQNSTVVLNAVLPNNTANIASNAANTFPIFPLAFSPGAPGFLFTIGGLSGAGNVNLVDSFGTAPVLVQAPASPNLMGTGGMQINLQIGNNNANTTYSGIMSGFGSPIKIGTGTLTLSGANSYLGGTVVNSGALIFSTASARPLTGTAATSSVATRLLTINNNSVAGTAGHVVVGGDSANLTSYRTQLLTGYNSGFWNNANAPQTVQSAASTQNLLAITSTTASSTNHQGIGYMTGADYTAFGNSASAFAAGYSVATSDVLLKYTYMGDATFDGKISAADYAQIDAGFLFPSLNKVWDTGDFNYDGVVNYLDYAIIDASYVAQSGPLANAMIAEHSAEFGAPYEAALAALGGAPAAVPEPASLSLLGCGALMLLRRKSRR